MSPIKSILIVGGGTAGWMTAAALSRTLDTNRVSITLIESESVGTVGVGEATIPNILTFNHMLGLDEREFMSATQATMKLGIEFIDWGQKGEAYMHPFGSHGADMEGLPFHQFWNRLRAAGSNRPIEDYCISAVAAYANKFTLPVPDPRRVESRLNYAYQFDATLYAALLRKYSEERSVTRIEGKIVNVDLNNETGFIKSVHMENGTSYDADLYIDCSGFRGLLIEQALQCGYEDWSHWLPCDSAVAMSCEKEGPVTPYTKATAREAGWQWRIPLQHRVGNGYVYSSQYTTDAAATAMLENSLEGKPLSALKQLRFKTGRRKKFWHKNCVALGLSAGFMEPLESTSIYLIQAGITKLLALFPDTSFPQIEIDEYNKILNLEFEQIRDFLILHYVATKRTGEPFWDYVRNMSIPETLKVKIELFESRGRFFRYDGDLFTETSWVAVLLGQNIVPERCNPLVDSVDLYHIKQSLESMDRSIVKAVSHMPSHDQFLRQYCPSEITANG